MDNEPSMTFANEEVSNLLHEKLFEQKQKAHFCDLTLLAASKVIKAHRSVLAAGSPYFDSILKHHKCNREQLVVHHADPDILQILIDYLYTGRVTVGYANVEELLRLADHFLVTKVIEFCIEFLGTKLDVENCLYTYYLTQKFKLKQLGNLVENWIVTHLNQVRDGSEILNMRLQSLEEFLQNKSFQLPFNETMKIITDYVLKNFPERENTFRRLLHHVDFSSDSIVDHNDIYKHYESCELYNKSEICAFYFLHFVVEKCRNALLTEELKIRYDSLFQKYEEYVREENQMDAVAKKYDTSSPISVKQKRGLRSGHALLRLTLALRPSIRAATLKTLARKNKNITLDEYLIDNYEESADENSPMDNGIQCPECAVNIADSSLLEQHLALSHAKDVTYKCSVCGYVCQYNGDYLTHMKCHFEGPPYRCDYCQIGCGDQIAKLIAHRARHLTETTFKCSFCSFKCRLKANYLKHLKVHTNNVKKCDICGYYTKFASHLIAHKKTHTANAKGAKNNALRPHSCAICGRGFMEKSHLVRHERIHLDDKPFKCQNCDYASSRRDKLKEHFARHHGANASAKVPYKARPMRGANKKQQYNVEQHQQQVNNSNTFNGNANSNDEIMLNHQQVYQQHHQPSTSSSATFDFQSGATANTSATTTAAAVAAAMMLDPRFHHTSTVNVYHPAMAVVQQQSSGGAASGSGNQQQQGDYQNCMTLF